MTTPSTDWAAIVRGLRPDEPWTVRQDSVIRSGGRVPVVHAWASFTFDRFSGAARLLTEIANRIEAYHVGEDGITVEIYHGYYGTDEMVWRIDLDLMIRAYADSGREWVADLLQRAPLDGDGARIATVQP